MLARRTLPEQYLAWNKAWKAPFGPAWQRYLPEKLRRRPLGARLLGPFVSQPNNSTRCFEYPWAYYAAPLAPGKSVVEIGGGMSGFQFVCSKSVAKYTNVDPFVDYGATEAYGADIDSLFSASNRNYGTNVVLIKSPLSEANIAPGSIDLVYSISVIEHLNPEELQKTLKSIKIILKPGGLFVATVDLFLNLAPFTSRQFNQWGTNVSIASLVEASGLTLFDGNTKELLGYPEFDSDFVLSHLEDYFVGVPYPALVQSFVLKG